jgi:hypothetical protein
MEFPLLDVFPFVVRWRLAAIVCKWRRALQDSGSDFYYFVFAPSIGHNVINIRVPNGCFGRSAACGV